MGLIAFTWYVNKALQIGFFMNSNSSNGIIMYLMIYVYISKPPPINRPVVIRPWGRGRFQPQASPSTGIGRWHGEEKKTQLHGQLNDHNWSCIRWFCHCF